MQFYVSFLIAFHFTGSGPIILTIYINVLSMYVQPLGQNVSSNWMATGSELQVGAYGVPANGGLSGIKISSCLGAGLPDSDTVHVAQSMSSNIESDTPGVVSYHAGPASESVLVPKSGPGSSPLSTSNMTCTMSLKGDRPGSELTMNGVINNIGTGTSVQMDPIEGRLSIGTVALGTGNHFNTNGASFVPVMGVDVNCEGTINAGGSVPDVQLSDNPNGLISSRHSDSSPGSIVNSHGLTIITGGHHHRDVGLPVTNTPMSSNGQGQGNFSINSMSRARMVEFTKVFQDSKSKCNQHT